MPWSIVIGLTIPWPATCSLIAQSHCKMNPQSEHCGHTSFTSWSGQVPFLESRWSESYTVAYFSYMLSTISFNCMILLMINWNRVLYCFYWSMQRRTENNQCITLAQDRTSGPIMLPHVSKAQSLLCHLTLLTPSLLMISKTTSTHKEKNSKWTPTTKNWKVWLAQTWRIKQAYCIICLSLQVCSSSSTSIVITSIKPQMFC